MPETFENRIRRITEPEYYTLVLIPQARMAQCKAIRSIRKAEKARVAFIVSSITMWKFQGLFNLLKNDSRFDPCIAIAPFTRYPQDQRIAFAQEMNRIFSGKGMSVIDLAAEDHPGQKLRKEINPDIIFYPQPYNHLFWNDLDCEYFRDKLICYIPYAALTASGSWAYRSRLNNTAWRLFYPNEWQKDDAKAVLYNNGHNIRIVGDAATDLFAAPAAENVWKPQERTKKRVIWAPHYSIEDEGLLHRNSFCWLSEYMWSLAQKYQKDIQFAFKPHPHLKDSLYKSSQWGREKADVYYERWANGGNTQLETGPYMELFKESDAMIHDSSSFTVEYHYTQKPVLFTSDNLDDVLSRLNGFGKDAVKAHYQAATEEAIESFIVDTVLNGNDPMTGVRKAFYDKYLRLPFGRSVCDNIYQELLEGLKFNNA